MHRFERLVTIPGFDRDFSFCRTDGNPVTVRGKRESGSSNSQSADDSLFPLGAAEDSNRCCLFNRKDIGSGDQGTIRIKTQRDNLF